MAKRRSDFVDISGLYKSLDEKKGRSCVQDAVTNDPIKLGVTISQYVLFKQWITNTKVDTRLIKLYSFFVLLVYSILIYVKFNILKHGTVYNLLRV